jgi:5-methyltetrahydrofolate--homocysteine methyltransferase
LQTKSAVIGAMRAKKAAGLDIPVWAQVTVETTGTMLLGSEIGAALTALAPLGIEIIGLNCATGPLEMSEHLRYLSQNSSIALSAMPNAGLPVLTSDGAFYPLSPAELAVAHEQFVNEYGLALIGGCCGTTPEHLKAVVEMLHGRSISKRNLNSEPSVSSLYVSVPFKQENTYLAIGERTNATGSKAFRDALLANEFEKCVDIAKEQIREGAHLLDLNIDYVGRDGVADMNKLSLIHI